MPKHDADDDAGENELINRRRRLVALEVRVIFEKQRNRSRQSRPCDDPAPIKSPHVARAKRRLRRALISQADKVTKKIHRHGERLHAVQRLRQVRDQIIRIFDPDGNSDQARRDRIAREFFRWHARMGH